METVGEFGIVLVQRSRDETAYRTLHPGLDGIVCGGIAAALRTGAEIHWYPSPVNFGNVHWVCDTDCAANPVDMAVSLSTLELRKTRFSPICFKTVNRNARFFWISHNAEGMFAYTWTSLSSEMFSSSDSHNIFPGEKSC